MRESVRAAGSVFAAVPPTMTRTPLLVCPTGSRSAQRYKQLVQMKYRRSVKRVLENNLDTRASRAFYRTWHHIRDSSSQLRVACLERDDKAKIRMNSSSTTHQHPTVTIGEGAGAVQHDNESHQL